MVTGIQNSLRQGNFAIVNGGPGKAFLRAHHIPEV